MIHYKEYLCRQSSPHSKVIQNDIVEPLLQTSSLVGEEIPSKTYSIKFPSLPSFIKQRLPFTKEKEQHIDVLNKILIILPTEVIETEYDLIMFKVYQQFSKFVKVITLNESPPYSNRVQLNLFIYETFRVVIKHNLVLNTANIEDFFSIIASIEWMFLVFTSINELELKDFLTGFLPDELLKFNNLEIIRLQTRNGGNSPLNDATGTFTKNLIFFLKKKFINYNNAYMLIYITKKFSDEATLDNYLIDMKLTITQYEIYKNYLPLNIKGTDIVSTIDNLKRSSSFTIETFEEMRNVVIDNLNTQKNTIIDLKELTFLHEGYIYFKNA